MGPWLVIAVVLGLVEGITEFLPISSTGHLILAGRLMGFNGATAGSFDIFIQLGAIAAVLFAYPGRFVRLANLQATDGFAGTRGILLLGLTTVPGLVVGGLFHESVKKYLFNPTNVAIGLAVGAVWIILAERFMPKPEKTSVDGLTWKEALAIGCFQCLALWPGMSRSAATILGGMVVGLDRRSAAEYSFFAAVPMLLAACLFDLWENIGLLTMQDVPLFAVGLLVSFVSAWIAVRFLVRFVAHHTLEPFGWYRLAVAAVVFLAVR